MFFCVIAHVDCVAVKVDVETERVSGKIPMLRVRNPWGDSHEWKGAWGDG